MKPFIDPSFWSDADIEPLTPSEKLTVLWLVTNPRTSPLGVCSATPERFAFETGLSPEALQRAYQALPRAFSKVGSVIFIRHFIRHQFGGGHRLKRNNFFVSLVREFESIKDEELKAEIMRECPELCEGLTKPSGPPKERKGKEGKGGECREGDPNRKPEAARFTKPTLEELTTEMNGIPDAAGEAQAFLNHFNSNGWRVGGRTAMKDWRGAAANWKRRAAKNGSSQMSFRGRERANQAELHKTENPERDW